MQPPSQNYHYPPQGAATQGIPPHGGAMYNQPGYGQHAAPGGNVTYTNGGGLQTTKQTPPATSGSLPSQQPPVSSMNGYYNGHQYQQNNPYAAPPSSAPQVSAPYNGMPPQPTTHAKHQRTIRDEPVDNELPTAKPATTYIRPATIQRLPPSSSCFW
uniref:Uncharacterized protein n=1 Tax=Ciona savignyi TaxID=51511 RepID=H2ZC31_CIOSA